jgi:hypothetical protein
VKRGYEYYDAHSLLNTYATNTADAHTHSYYSKSVVTVEVLHFFRRSSHSPSVWSVTCDKELRSNIILSSMPGSSKWYLCLRFPHQNPVYNSPIPHTCYMPYSIHLHYLIISDYICPSIHHASIGHIHMENM